MFFQSLTLILLVFLCTHLSVSAETRQFHNADQSKSFFAELTHYDFEHQQVSVKMKNGRKQHFPINILSEIDQKYVIENGKRLAINKDVRVTLKRFNHPSKKSDEGGVVNRIYPTGYSISLNNRAKRAYTKISLNYTIYYAVQGYLDPQREQKIISGTLTCKKITALEKISLKTQTIDIITGKSDPVYDDDGNLIQPEGRRKDLVLGCKVDLLVGGEIVKSITDGTIGIKKL
ncbi:MAG: hypothetical protein KJO21_08475 [Verrucomicrobiae bacterium]|nr:hypothetical protein [Verrucomicrobiae bacterium]NNJ43508.1 hypothetical protein [Akkermansiaceae bacterium]